MELYHNRFRTRFCVGVAIKLNFAEITWMNDMVGEFTIKNHAHKDSFDEFFEWCEVNGLVGEFLRKESESHTGWRWWYVVNVKPKE